MSLDGGYPLHGMGPNTCGMSIRWPAGPASRMPSRNVLRPWRLPGRVKGLGLPGAGQVGRQMDVWRTDSWTCLVPPQLSGATCRSWHTASPGAGCSEPATGLPPCLLSPGPWGKGLLSACPLPCCRADMPPGCTLPWSVCLCPPGLWVDGPSVGIHGPALSSQLGMVGGQTWLKGVVILSSMWCLLVRVGEPGVPQASLFWHTPSMHRSEVWSGLAVRASGVEVPGVWL